MKNLSLLFIALLLFQLSSFSQSTDMDSDLPKGTKELKVMKYCWMICFL